MLRAHQQQMDRDDSFFTKIDCMSFKVVEMLHLIVVNDKAAHVAMWHWLCFEPKQIALLIIAATRSSSLRFLSCLPCCHVLTATTFDLCTPLCPFDSETCAV